MNEFSLTSRNLAKIIHGVTSAIDRMDGSTPKTWEEISVESQDRATSAVQKILSLDYCPSAQECHNLWLWGKLEDGWIYGEKFSVENKTHPSIINFDHLPESEILKDQIWSAMTSLFGKYVKD